MKPSLFLTGILIGISTLFKAQDFPNYESPGLRIDPLSVQTLSASQFGWAYDLQYDKEGNLYCAGYLKGNSQDTALKFLDANCNNGCYEHLIFSKYNSQGKREWLLTSNHNVRPTAIRFSKKGEIVLAGTFHLKAPVFYGTGGTQASDQAHTELEAGFFITRYTKEGRVINCQLLPGYELNGFEMDEKDNLYLAGVQDYRLSSDRSSVRRQFLFQGLTKKGETIFKILGDTIGESQGGSVSLHGKRIMLCLTYSGHCSLATETLQSSYGQSGALLFFSMKGELQRVIDSLDGEVMAPAAAVYDEQGTVFIASGGYNHPLNLYALNRDLTLRWRSSVPLNGSTTVSKLLPTQNKLYLCGQGYAAIFGKSSAYNYVFKSKGSADAFVAAYKKTGEIEWVKAAGGESTDFCAGMGIYNKQLSLFGFVNFGGDFQFKSKQFTATNTLWLATYSLDSLEKVIHGPGPAPPVQQATVEVNAGNCTCSYNNSEYPVRFLPSVSSFIDAKDLRTYFKWEFGSSYDVFKQVFLSDYYADANSVGVDYSFNAHVFGPLVVTHPRRLFQLEFLPCKPKEKEMLLPIILNYSDPMHDVEQWMPLAKGDTSAMAIYDVLFWKNEVGHDQLLANWFNTEYVARDYKPWVKAINKKYKLNLALESTNIDAWIAVLLARLEEKKINVDTFLVNELVCGKKPAKRISKQEWQNLCELFQYNYNGDLAQLLYDCAKVLVVKLDENYAYFRVDTNMLQNWNPMQPKASGASAEAKLLLKFNNFQFHSMDGSSGIVSEFYTKPIKIAGTKARFKLKSAGYEESKQRGLFDQRAGNYYSSAEPLAFGPLPVAPGGETNIFLKQPEIENFAGLQSYDGTLWLDYADTTYNFNIRSIYLNNEIVFGSLELNNFYLRNDTLFASDRGSHKHFTAAELEQAFITAGFDKVQVEKVENSFWIRFYRKNKSSSGKGFGH